MAETTQLLYLQNPWWRTSPFIFKEGSWPKRKIYDKFHEFIDLQQMTALIGLRRTGKTTILRQCIDNFLKKQVNPLTLCYFSFEELGVAKESRILEEVIEKYFSQILKKKVLEVEKAYFFLDEVQFIPYWQSILKRYYDLNKNIKFVISGSSSLFIRREAKESLVGRIFDIHLPPLSFREFLELRNEINVLPHVNIWQGDVKPSESELHSLKEMSGLFLSFLSWGQFPELLAFSDFEKKRLYLKEWVIEKILGADLPAVLKIDFTEKLKSLAYVLLEGSGQEIEFTNLAQDLGLSRETIRQYASYLEKACLVSQIINYSGSFRRRERRNRKIYAASSNFFSIILGEDEMGLNFQKNIGKIVETYVCTELMNQFSRVYFWRERGKEVDFIVGDEKGLFPVEVKYQEKIRKEDYKNLLLLMKRKSYQKAFMLSKNQWEDKRFGDKIIYLRPVFLI